MANTIKRIKEKFAKVGDVNGVEIFQNMEDEKLYYKDLNGKVIPITNTTLTELEGVPSFTGNAGSILAVNNNEDGIEPIDEITIQNLNFNSIFGPLQDFTVPGVGTQTGADLGPVVIIPGVLELSRNDSGGAWFNSVSESSYSNFPIPSPADTEWNSIYTDPALNGFTDFSNLSSRVYGGFAGALNNQVGVNATSTDLICHVISTDQYFKVNITSWDSGGGLGPYGGFAVEFTEVILENLGEITFSDGSRMSTAPVVPPDLNTWDMATVGFVDPSVPFGSGTLGDGNDPFRRVLDAVNAGASVIWLKPATYTETITLQSNKTYYCPAGVKFTSGGLRAPSGTLSNCKWLGNAVFEGNFGAVYFITFCQFVDFVLEFDYIRTTGNAFPDMLIWGNISTKSTIFVKGNFIDSFGGNGQATGFIGNIDGSINLERMICNYQPWALGFTGPYPAPARFTINCPMTIMRDAGWLGQNGAFKNAAPVYNCNSTMDIEINGRFRSEVTTLLGSINALIVTWSSGSDGRISWNGDKDMANYTRGFYNTRPTTKIISRGNVNLPNGRLTHTTNSGEISVEKGNTVVALSSILGSTGTTYIKNVHIHAIGVAQNIFDLNTNSHSLYMDNVVAEGDGGAGLLVNTGGNARSAGLKDTWSTQANDGAFTNLYASGFVQEANLISNKIL